MQQRAAAEFLAEAERHDETAAVCLSHRTLGTTYVQMGEFGAGRQHLERARKLYDPKYHSQSRYLYGQDIGATALSYLCWALWHLGYVDQAAAVADEATKRAEALSHPFTLAYTICHARGMMDVFRRCPEDTQSYAKTVISICTEHDFPFWAAGGPDSRRLGHRMPGEGRRGNREASMRVWPLGARPARACGYRSFSRSKPRLTPRRAAVTPL